MSSIYATCVELINVSIVYLPNNVTIGITYLISSTHCESTNTLHTCSCHLAEATTIDVTFCIVIVIFLGGIIHTCQIEFIKVSASYRNRRMGADKLIFCFILMDANMEFLEPHIATHMVVSNRFSFFMAYFLSSNRYPLFYYTTLQNHRTI